MPPRLSWTSTTTAGCSPIPVARRALIVTLVFTAVTTVVLTVPRLVIAVLVNEVWRSRRGRRPDDPVHPRHRLVRRVGGAVETDLRPEHRHPEPVARARSGLDEPAAPWLADRSTVLPAIIVVAIWGGLGLNMLIFFAGIQSIDPSLYEAAAVDGANTVQQFWNITVPSLRVVTGDGRQPRPAERVQGLRHHLRDDRRRPEPRQRGARHLPVLPGLRVDVRVDPAARVRQRVQRGGDGLCTWR